MLCFHVSDLHGNRHRYRALFKAIEQERPDIVLVGGDVLPLGLKMAGGGEGDFLLDFLMPALSDLRDKMADGYPRIMLIPGNDDPRVEETFFLKMDHDGLITYLNNKGVETDNHLFFGYPFVPPTPFRLKDWERYDVSRYVDPGCVSPEDGVRTVETVPNEIRYGTIQDDLQNLVGDTDLKNAVMLFHAPPYRTKLDRAALDGKMVDHVPLDVHVGSIAIRRFIEERQPLLTLHGHIHESARLTGAWRDRIGRTHIFNAAHDGPELALVQFEPDNLSNAVRKLI